MKKSQVIAVSTVAAIPAIALLVFLVLGLLQGMLADGASVKVTLWIAWVLAALCCVVVGFLPLAILFFPGLLPEPAAAGAADSAVGLAPSPPAKRSSGDDETGDDGDGEDFEGSEEGEGEQLFEDDAMDEDFDDEFGDSFEDDEK